jgi:hypothetical protein
MNRGPGPKRRTALGRTTATLRRSEGLTRGSGPPNRQKAAQAPVAFRASTPAARHQCATCGPWRSVTSPGRTATTYHHVVPQRWIRDHVRGLHIEDEAQERRLLRRLLRDPRNLVPLCDACHARQENPGIHCRPVRQYHFPPGLMTFAMELGDWCVARVERLYPPT